MQYPLDRDYLIARQAESLYERVWRRAQRKRWWARLTGQSRQIPLLQDARRRYSEIKALPPVQQDIRVGHVVGTIGSLNFDRDFLPLTRRERDRWLSVAEAMLNDVTLLPPIQVVQVELDYYVIDGHHRVSVAKALERLYLFAEVTVWETVKEAVPQG